MFFEQFEFKLPALVNFVGGGGKTGLILALLEEGSHSGAAIYSTTTRIHPPHPVNGMAIFSSDSSALLHLVLERSGRICWQRPCKFVVTGPAISPTLLGGVEPSFARSLNREIFRLILNEADGARSMSLKMPREGEPVLMEDANYLVPVIGLDCLGKPLGPETLFRWEMAADRYGLRQGERITPELAASLLLHPQGVCRDWRPEMQIIPFINKADTEAHEASARGLAYALLSNGTFPVERVVWGSLERGRSASVTARKQ